MKHGFSLIELTIVILIIGIIASLGVPRFLRGTRTQTEHFVAQLNGLIQDGILLALQTRQSQKIFFDLPVKKVEIQTLNNVQTKRSIVIPQVVDIEDVIINGKSSFTNAGEKRTVYFLINPEGITQEVTMIIIDKAINSRNARAGRYEFYLNPFSGVLRLQ